MCDPERIYALACLNNDTTGRFYQNYQLSQLDYSAKSIGLFSYVNWTIQLSLLAIQQ